MVAAGEAVTPVSAKPGETVAAEVAAGVAAGVAAAVRAGVSVGVSVGVSGRGTNGVGTSLAWLAGLEEGDGEVEGLVMGLPGAGEGDEGQRLQVAAQ